MVTLTGRERAYFISSRKIRNANNRFRQKQLFKRQADNRFKQKLVTPDDFKKIEHSSFNGLHWKYTKVLDGTFKGSFAFKPFQISKGKVQARYITFKDKRIFDRINHAFTNHRVESAKGDNLA